VISPSHLPSNNEIIRVLHQLVELLTLAEGSKQAFRVRAYEKAIGAVESLPMEVAELDQSDLIAVPGIGKSIAAKIREYVDTGAITTIERLRAEYPPGLVELTRIPGLGPKTVVMLRDELGVENVDQLRGAIAADRLRDLPGLGSKSQLKIAAAIDRLGLHGKERRTPIAEALPIAQEVVAALEDLGTVRHVEYCGSLRRLRDTVADIDIVAAAGNAATVTEAFVALPVAAEVIVSGDTKTSVLTGDGVQIDLRVVEPGQFGAAVLYFTGSKAHNIELRQRAIGRGMLLNEYALEDQETGRTVAGRTERSIYRALGLELIPPEMREGHGEVEAAEARRLPPLVTEDAIRGDLHVHSDWSGDGRSPLDAMVAAAAARGLDYVAITEHGEDLAINGLSRERVRAERVELERLRHEYPDLLILHGAELNIGAGGDVDYDPDFLAAFDWCVASVHTHFDLPEADQTARLLTAMENPAVSAIGHLTGRRIGHRPGIDFDLMAICEAAAATGTALEINSHLHRLDVPAEMLLRARDVAGLRFVISTDSHHTTEFANLRWGTANARRGWVDRHAVINTWPRRDLLEFIAAKRGRSTP
jgi:DNA polymerase (family 10)